MYLVTGAAGFIGFHLTCALLARGEKVVGVDSVNNYYTPTLKEARLAALQEKCGDFTFVKYDIADHEGLKTVLTPHLPHITHVIHLAAQAGVRYSLEAPFAYTHANVNGQLSMLELCRRHLPNLKHFVYASSSSVYGANTKLPFSVDDRTDAPVSLYAATKKSGEMLAQSYAHMYKIPATGLRFFTVYGAWGRPDMAYFSFTQKILGGEPIQVFNKGQMHRDFTYIDDIVAGILGASSHIPTGDAPHNLFNLGNHRSELLLDMIEILQSALGKKANIDWQPMQTGDVLDTYADIEASTKAFGFTPTTPLSIGLPKFVEWFKEFYARVALTP